jgi:hypothetical protein
MKNVVLLSGVLMAGLLCAVAPPAGGQQESQPSPDQWRKLPLEEFVSEIYQLTSAKQPLSGQVWRELRSQSLERLRGVLDTGAKADYFDLIRLYMWGRDTLTQQQKDSMLNQLAPPLDDAKGWAFEKLQSTIDWMGWAGTPKAYRDTLLAAWLKDRDIESVGRSTSERKQFAWLCREVLLAEEQLPKDVLEAVRSQAVREVRGLGADADITYDDLLALYLGARGGLAPQEHPQALALLNSKAPEVASWGYWQMRHRYDRIDGAGLPPETRELLLVAWLKGRDIGSLSPVDDLAWLYEKLHYVRREEVATLRFSVRWAGFVQAPDDGTYTFSICPINLDIETTSFYRRQTTAVWIANRRILDSRKNGWTFQSEPVTLKAGEKTPIRVELSYACSRKDVFEDRPAVAILMWEGPETNRCVVPESALSPPKGDGHGLQAEYQWQESGQQRTVDRIDPTVDYIWYRGCYLVPNHPEVRSRLADRLWVLVTDPRTLAKWELTDAARDDYWLAARGWFLESLSSARHKTLLTELLSRPGLVESISPSRVRELYRYCRIGAPDQALELLGKWAQMHADVEPVFGEDYYHNNRELFRDLCRRTIWECRPHFETLEARYLELPDGRCSLPVAYTVCYGYWVEGRAREWIDKLDARLRDKGLAGDRRVNWLLARGQAEEIRLSPPHRHWLTVERFLAGYLWVEQACSAALSEPVRLRAYKELATRLAAEERPQAARETLDAAARRCSQASSRQKLAAWRQEVNQLADRLEARHKAEDAAAQQAYIAALRRRHKRAVGRGDQEAISHYEELLSAAGAAAKEGP